MLIAELYAKLPDFVRPGGSAAETWRPQDQEDLLTADGLGVLRYLPRQLFLLEVLRRARRVSDRKPLVEVFPEPMKRAESESSGLELLFWSAMSSERWLPAQFARVRADDGRGWLPVTWTEPDLLIRPQDIDSGNPAPPFVVMVEAKYKGSDLGDDPSQLAREFVVAERMASRARASRRSTLEFILLAVTNHQTAPLVRRPRMTSDGQGIEVGEERIPAHQQVAEYCGLVARNWNAEIASECGRWSQLAHERIFHVGWKDVADAIAKGTEELKALEGRASLSPSSVANCVSGARLLAEEARRLLVEMRGLRRFHGFERLLKSRSASVRPQEGFLFLDANALRRLKE